jgi:hypothetical protein
VYKSAGKEKVAKEERQVEKYPGKRHCTGGERQEQRERVKTHERPYYRRRETGAKLVS